MIGKKLLQPEGDDHDRGEDGHGNQKRQDENDEVRAQFHRCANREFSVIGSILTSRPHARVGNFFHSRRAGSRARAGPSKYARMMAPWPTSSRSQSTLVRSTSWPR